MVNGTKIESTLKRKSYQSLLKTSFENRPGDNKHELYNTVTDATQNLQCVVVVNKDNKLKCTKISDLLLQLNTTVS